MMSSILYPLAAGLLIFLVNTVRAFWRRELSPDSPWGLGSTTLERTLPSPPPFHQYEIWPLIK
jgi:cytochrome c oxidase subunit 1